MTHSSLFLLYVLIPTLGVLAEALALGMLDGRKRLPHWSSSRYAFAVSLILLSTIIVASLEGRFILWIFVGSVLLGTCAEWFTGWSYRRIEDRFFWKYFKGTKEGYTSFFVMPVWGFAGVLFYLFGDFVREVVALM